MARIEPLAQPYPEEFAARMKVLMRGADPLVLFTTLAKHERAWGKFGGGSLLDKGSPLAMRAREIVIDRTTARCGCEYEWGVHIAGFAPHIGLTDEQISATVHGAADDPVWQGDEAVLIATVDALLDRKRLNDDEWSALRLFFDEPQALEIIQLVAFYHGVALICGALDLPLETNAARFPAVSGDNPNA
jgi:alkylhydroperoxidase family enzyme